jgi:hypothetical protein
VFAARSIPKGTRILAERPTFTITSDRDLIPAFKRISSEERTFIKELSRNTTTQKPPILDTGEAIWHLARSALSNGLFSVSEYKTLLAAFRNNSFDIGDSRRAIFHDTSRLNHSCLPNAQGNFNTALGAFTIHTVHSVAENEEILISYLDEHGGVRASRQARLLEGYGFVCECPACDTTGSRGQEGERRRKVVRQKLVDFTNEAAKKAIDAGKEGERDLKGELGILLELVKMFEKEGLVGRELATMYLAAAEGSQQLGDVETAKKYARLGVEMEEMCLGTDNPMYKESVARARNIAGVVIKT